MHRLEDLVLDLENLSSAVAWDLLLEAERLEHTVVEHGLGLSAVLELHVGVVETLEVQLELRLAVRVQVGDHGRRASGHAAALLETVDRPVGPVLLLALHEVVVVVLATVADVEGGREQRPGGGPDLRDVRDFRRERSVLQDNLGISLSVGGRGGRDGAVCVGRGHLAKEKKPIGSLEKYSILFPYREKTTRQRREKHLCTTTAFFPQLLVRCLWKRSSR